ncbi:Integral membrane protein TerC family protein [Aquisphaera giovannonii]|uniref:Integral membrane protein TerC family protein n=1 Tax=Aquisphaera giovannonii TaxID=406548 RepID=A0A5B9W7H4_9BACT|nr:TerC family protein [Aquisphaera giovannonii]QEH36035.1 Integral membrane protein TerC family protein [Aquisphaera giovannonii]
MTAEYIGSILKLVLIDLVLSGDNAVVIGLAAHLLPPRHRRKAMLWGCGVAILMRVSLTLVVAQLLLVPGLRLVGGLMLAWIAAKLLQEGADAGEEPDESPTTLWKAIVRIAMADFIMSLDNVLAIAGASDSDPARVMIGLVLSISMLLLLSAVIMEVMARYRWIAFLGAAVLAWTAADMMAKDFSLMAGGDGHDGTSAFPAWAAWLLRFAVVALCLSVNMWRPRKPATVPDRASPLPVPRASATQQADAARVVAE